MRLEELARRIAFTIGALLIYRLGCHLPMTGSWPVGAASAIGVDRVSIFALGVVPYVSAALFIHLIAMVWRRLGLLERSGEAGRRRMARYVLILTLLLAAFQALGVSSALQDIPGLVAPPDAWFLISATVSMVGGVFFLVWLSEQITRHGIGNGLALILAVPILASLPAQIANLIEVMRQGGGSPNLALLHAGINVVMVALIIFVEGARRNVPIEFAARQVGKRLLPRRSSVLPLKVNSAGFLIPVTVAPWLIHLPLALAAVVFGSGTPWVAAAYQYALARPVYLPVVSVTVFVLAFIYTACVLDPEQAADTLREQQGTIPGVEAGAATADYLDRAVSLTTVNGAAYLVGLLLIPEALVLYGHALPYIFSGGSALIVVCTILDIRTQVRDVSLTNPGGVRQ